MNFVADSNRSHAERPDEDEIASLALKFYLDSECLDGRDRENRLCAEYMLAQKHLIEYQISTLHDRVNTSGLNDSPVQSAR